MEFMVFGNEHNPLFLFYHASCSHWSWYQDAIEKLTEQFFVIVPILDGYNGDYSSDFSSVESTATETTAYLLEHGHKEIDFVYGLSMGGGMVLYMLAQNQVSVKNAVVDGGITPYNLPRIATFLIAVRDYLGIKLLRKSPALIKMAFPPDRWLLSTQTEEAYRDMQGFLKTMSNKTIWNTFYSANNYCMPLPFLFSVK